jgi:hypothetical protein
MEYLVGTGGLNGPDVAGGKQVLQNLSYVAFQYTNATHPTQHSNVTEVLTAMINTTLMPGSLQAESYLKPSYRYITFTAPQVNFLTGIVS